MGLTLDGSTRLIAWAALVLFELYTLSDSKRARYDSEVGELRTPYYQIPSWVFAWIWYTLKALIVASMYFWAEYATDLDDWTYPTVFALTFALVVFSKFWMPLFFQWRMYTYALCLSLVLAAHAITIMVLMIITSNEGTLWALPFALFVPVTAWYCFAALLSFAWYRFKVMVSVSSMEGDEERPTVVYYNPSVRATPAHKSRDTKLHKYGHPHSAHDDPTNPMRHPQMSYYSEKQVK